MLLLNKAGLRQKNVYYKANKGNSEYYENLLHNSLTDTPETPSYVTRVFHGIYATTTTATTTTTS
jgi:hypothetical protein